MASMQWYGMINVMSYSFTKGLNPRSAEIVAKEERRGKEKNKTLCPKPVTNYTYKTKGLEFD
jgi:hypothetical protein